MDIDSNDILTTNIFIPKPNLNPNIVNSDDFKNFYKNKIIQEQQDSISKIIKNRGISNINYNESDDTSDITHTQPFSLTNESSKTIEKRNTREQVTLISVDSRDRDKILYNKPNNFKIFLNKTFTNVKKIKLVKLEFPNTNSVIYSANNKIFWRNQEDIDLDYTTITKGITTYPMYNVNLRIGSYDTSSLQKEITTKLTTIRRTQGTSNGSIKLVSDYHFFVISLDVDTDIVTFTSLILTQLPNNPLSTTAASGVISVNAPAHGYSTNDYIYINGPKQTAGIAATILTGFQQIIVINSSTFTFEVSVKASDTITGGGNVIKTGRKAPFQLLWGENSNTVAQNIGYPLENSSEIINTNISQLENISQMTITTILPHNFDRSYVYIGNLIQVGYLTASTFTLYRTYQIMDITGTNTFLVQVNDSGVADDLMNNFVQAELIQFTNSSNVTTQLQVSSYTNYIINSFLITTQTPHNYTLNNIGNNITLYNTSDLSIKNDPNYDGTYTIMEIPSDSSLIVPGALGIVNTHTSGLYGTIPRQTPITTHTLQIDILTPNYINISGLYYTYIKTIEYHKLNVDDQIYINNVNTTPVLKQAYTIYSVYPDGKGLLIQLELVNVDQESVKLGFLGTGLITVSFPSHEFNYITNISNGIPVSSVLPLIITTFNPHNFINNNTVRLSNTNTTPNIDGGGYIVTVIDPYNFSIVKPSGTFSALTNIPTILTGTIGLSNDFYLYGVESIGGISSTLINGMLFTVRDIIDNDTFTFMIKNIYATSTEIGGGSNVYISSLKHGFNGVQTNTKNNILNRSINLQGEDYCFLTCPQLDTVLNTGSVQNVFARISLDQPPGYVCFNFLSNPKIYEPKLLDKLEELEFSVVNYDNTYYEFSDIDFSFCLEIIEEIYTNDSSNMNSRTGI